METGPTATRSGGAGEYCLRIRRPVGRGVNPSALSLFVLFNLYRFKILKATGHEGCRM